MPNMKKVNDEFERFYHYLADSEMGVHKRMFENAYLKNHSYFLDFVTEDHPEPKDPLIQALWHNKYNEETKSLVDDSYQRLWILQNEAILTIASIVYTESMQGRRETGMDMILEN